MAIKAPFLIRLGVLLVALAAAIALWFWMRKAPPEPVQRQGTHHNSIPSRPPRLAEPSVNCRNRQRTSASKSWRCSGKKLPEQERVNRQFVVQGTATLVARYSHHPEAWGFRYQMADKLDDAETENDSLRTIYEYAVPWWQAGFSTA